MRQRRPWKEPWQGGDKEPNRRNEGGLPCAPRLARCSHSVRSSAPPTFITLLCLSSPYRSLRTKNAKIQLENEFGNEVEGSWLPGTRAGSALSSGTEHYWQTSVCPEVWAGIALRKSRKERTWTPVHQPSSRLSSSWVMKWIFSLCVPPVERCFRVITKSGCLQI